MPMKKMILSIIACLLVNIIPSMAQKTYSTLWKQVNEVQQNDLPQTAIAVLNDISRQAQQEKAWGHMLKAEAQKMQFQIQISPDSLKAEVERLKRCIDNRKSYNSFYGNNIGSDVTEENKSNIGSDVSEGNKSNIGSDVSEENKSNIGSDVFDGNNDDYVCLAVKAAVLSRTFLTYRKLIADDWNVQAARYAMLAMQRPALLADTKANNYFPLVVEGYNSNIFGDDLLSVIAYETKQYSSPSRYYSSVGNRRAACITALQDLKTSYYENAGKGDLKTSYYENVGNGRRTTISKSPYIYSLDSLIAIYKDLDVAAEVAIERYYAMKNCSDNKAEKLITYIHYIIDNWPSWQRTGEMRNEERTLTYPQLQCVINNRIVMPGKEPKLILRNIRNMKQLTVNIYPTTLDGNSDIRISNEASFKKNKKYLRNPQQPLSTTFTLPYHPNYELFDDTIAINPLPTGIYVVETTTQPATYANYSMLYVTDVTMMKQVLPGKQVRYAVVSRLTGKPLNGATIEITESNKHVKTIITDKYGEAIYKYENHLPRNEYSFTADDKAAPRQNIFADNHFEKGDGKRKNTLICTDRSIYRPGQTVHVSAICYRNENWITAVADEGRNVKATLYDNDNNIVTERTLKADDYGTVATDFLLPEKCLTGSYRISVDDEWVRIKVEEYKRPTFMVEIPKVNSPYSPGDTLQMQGKAMTYAGVPVQGAKVKYTVKRKVAHWWWRWNNDENTWAETVASEETTTDADGRFDIEMPLTLAGDSKTTRRFYDFTVSADVTDTSGETRTGTMTLPLGSRATAISCNIGEKVLADSLKGIVVYLKNAAGLDVSTEARMNIDGGEWLHGRTMQPIALAKPLATGTHTLTAICDHDTLVHRFITFNLDDKVPCSKTDDWFFCSADKFKDNGDITIQVGSSDSIHVVYTIVADNKVIESGRTELNNELINRRLSYRKEYGDGITMAFAWIRDGKFYSHTQTISRPLPDKELKIKWTTFRDRLLPGQQETWTLNVTRPDGKPADARLMATLYDKSLDQLMPHQWIIDAAPWVPLFGTSWSTMNNFTNYMPHTQSFTRYATRAFEFSHFDNTIFGIHYSNKMIRGYGKTMRSASAPMVKADSEMWFDSVESVSTVKAKETVNLSVKEEDDTQSSEQDNTIRENFDETAFFYPMLNSDKDGNVTMKFTLPETLTTWNFMGVANTRDMMYGSIEAETVAQKEIMVQPNMPRFLRSGDEARITTKIFNTGNYNVDGNIRMEIVDPETGQTIMTKSQPFAVEVAKTTDATFTLRADESCQLLVIRIIASGKNFSDGEQHYVAVMPAKERVTQTHTFSQDKPGTTTIDLRKMFAVTDKTSRLTVEYTNNPAWLMVQALPLLAQPHDANAISLAASLYSNTLARHLANAEPAIANTCRLWKEEKDDGTSLVSSLEKNTELKDMILDETPWLTEAKTETEQKRMLAALFDANTINARTQTALAKLQKLQNADGSWSWWQGMSGSTFMTQAIATIMARMKTFTGNDIADNMLNKAMKYLDVEMTKTVSEMKAEEKKGHTQTFPSATALEYLYTNALLSRTPSGNRAKATDYLVSLLKKEQKTMSMFAKAMAAIVLDSHGDSRKAKTYLKSIVEHTVCTEAAGRYFDSFRAVSTWRDYKIPTQTMAIEALCKVGDDNGKYATTIAEMQRWLLQEKRTQTWDTPISSIDAINAFLTPIKGRQSPLAANSTAALFTIDGTQLDMPKATAGMGYQKTTMTYGNQRKLTATKTSQGSSWASVYAQYMQTVTDIADSGEGITIKREIIIPEGGLKVGSRVKTRITIDALRDLDFVEIADRRAACMEPIQQLSGYHNGAYVAPKDNATYYYFDRMKKGRHVIETEYFIDREGKYHSGTCTAQCAYAPEFRATAGGISVEVGNK